MDVESLGVLLGRLIEDLRAVARAEIAVVRQKALSRVKAAVPPLAAIGAGLLMVIGSISALMVGIALWLAQWIGPLGGGAASCVIGLAVAGLLVRAGVRMFSPARPALPAKESLQ